MTDADDTVPAPSPATSSALAGLRRGGLVLLVLFFVWLVFGHAVPHALHGTETPGVIAHEAAPHMADEKDAQIADLKTRVDQLEAKIKTLEDAFPKSTGGDSAAEVKIDALQARVEALQQQVQQPGESAADSERIGQLEDSVHKQEDLIRKQDESVAALNAQIGSLQGSKSQQLMALTAFGPLRDAVLHGEPFAAGLAQMGRFTADNAKAQDALAQIKPYADAGITTPGGLQSLFDATVPKALSPDGGNALGRYMQSLIRIRKVGEQKGSDDEAILARAEVRLGRGEIEPTLKELAQLSPPAKDAFSAWTGKAQDYLHARESIDALQLALVQDKADAAPTPQTVVTPPSSVVAPAPQKADMQEPQKSEAAEPQADTPAEPKAAPGE